MSDGSTGGTGHGGCGGNAAPYVLGALPEADSAAFAEHLAECAVCREEVAALRSVASALPAAAPQFTAPPELKRRLLAEIDREARVPSGVGRARARASRGRLSLRAPQFGRLAPAGAGFALAAALAVVLVLALGGSGGSTPRFVRADVTAPGASATLKVSAGRAELQLANMPQAPRGRVYELWLTRAGAPVPTDALFTVSSRGSATVGIPGGVRGVREVLVTSEPVGGSPAPTRSPVVVARLS